MLNISIKTMRITDLSQCHSYKNAARAEIRPSHCTKLQIYKMLNRNQLSPSQTADRPLLVPTSPLSIKGHKQEIKGLAVILHHDPILLAFTHD